MDPETPSVPPPEQYSAFSIHEKRFIVFMATVASFFSPLSAQIYFPIMPTLVHNYHLTTALINLTVTTYLILQGLAPSFMASIADSSGRRLAYIISLVIYTAANFGLARQNSYAALMILRCLQSAGSSGTVAFGYGVVADIATPAERGSYIGPMAAGVMIAPALGPVIGGILAKSLGWRSIFWFLVIASGSYLALFIIAMPETARNVVGNGGRPPKEWWRMSVLQYCTVRYRVKDQQYRGEEDEQALNASSARGNNSRQQESRSTKLSLLNPLKTFAILLEPDAAIVILYIGLVMLANVALMTSTPSLFKELYGFNALEIGLCFIPLGVSGCLGSILTGKFLDLNYQRLARKQGLPIDRRHGDDLRHFPIEKARLQAFFPLVLVGIIALIPYGFALEERAPLIVPLLLQFILGLSFIAANNALSTLLVDLFPDRPATASAASNLVRCWLGALGAAVIDPMLKAMGWGWCFLFWALVMIPGLRLMWLEYKKGMGWRHRRLTKLERRRREEQQAGVELAAMEGNDRTKDDDPLREAKSPGGVGLVDRHPETLPE